MGDMKEIQIPANPPPPTLEDQIRGAIYCASSYYWPTKLTCGPQTAYLVDRWTYERLMAGKPLLEIDAEQVVAAKVAVVQAWEERAAADLAASPQDHVDALVHAFIAALRIKVRTSQDAPPETFDEVLRSVVQERGV